MRPETLLAAAVLAFFARPALAGSPYATDDPEPTEPGHAEVYGFAAGGHVRGETGGEAGLDISYGAAKNLQLSLVLPMAYDRSAGHTSTGLGVVETGFKYKFLDQADGGWTPAVAVFPRLLVPTAPARFGSRHLNLLLPVWAQRDFGPWSVFGGGGWQLNPGAGNRDFWTGGLAVTRQVTERVNLGAEITHRTRDAADGRDFTALNVGAILKVNDRWSLVGAVGPGVQNARTEGRYVFYLALKADY